MILDPNEELWRLPKVIKVIGLSKTEIYRQAKAGKFPQPRKYKNSDKSFWPASEIRQWQKQQFD